MQFGLHCSPQADAPEVDPVESGPALEAATRQGLSEEHAGESLDAERGRSNAGGARPSTQVHESAAAGLAGSVETAEGSSSPETAKTQPAHPKARGGKPSKPGKSPHREGNSSRNSKGNKGRVSSKGAGAQAGDQLVREIRDEQRSVHRCEGEAVASLVVIGVKLIELKAGSGRTWGQRLRTLGYSPRVASRLQMLGKAWGVDSGRIASDLLSRLPMDLNKLEWLCRLDAEQLRGLLSDIDARRSGRGEIVAAVRAILNQEPPSGASADGALVGSIVRMFDRLDKVLGKINGEEVDPDQATLARDALASGLSRLQASLYQADDGRPVD